MKLGLLIIAIAALAAGVFGWQDTADYRALRQAFEAEARERLPQAQAQVQQDEERYRRCDALRSENPATRRIEFTPEGRLCLIDALERTASVQGALVLSRNAAMALAVRPDDALLRAAAQNAIDTARSTLASHKPWLYDRQEQLQQAHADSLVMRVLQRPELRPLGFERQASLLDQAEYALNLPQLFRRQQVWRMEALLPPLGR